MNKKIFVLDTNVLISDPKAIFHFDEHDIVIPIVVIEELDKFKKDMNQIGLSARAFARHIEELRQQGSLIDGVPLANGGSVKIVLMGEAELPGPKLSTSYADNVILSTAY